MGMETGDTRVRKLPRVVAKAGTIVAGGGGVDIHNNKRHIIRLYQYLT